MMRENQILPLPPTAEEKWMKREGRERRMRWPTNPKLRSLQRKMGGVEEALHDSKGVDRRQRADPICWSDGSAGAVIQYGISVGKSLQLHERPREERVSEQAKKE